MTGLILTQSESDAVLFKLALYRRLSVGELERAVGAEAAERFRRCRIAYRERWMDMEFGEPRTEGEP